MFRTRQSRRSLVLVVICSVTTIVLYGTVNGYVGNAVGTSRSDHVDRHVIVKVRADFLPHGRLDARLSAAALSSRRDRVLSLAAGLPVEDAIPLWPPFVATTSGRSGTQKSAAAFPSDVTVEPQHPGASTFVLRLARSTDIDSLVTELQNLPWVEFAEIDRRFELDDELPNDSLFANLWGLHNTGQSYLSVESVPGNFNDTLGFRQGTAGADIGYEELRAYPGPRTPVLLAILDTGVDPTHPDLEARMWRNPGEIAGNGIDDDHNGLIDDINGWDFSGDDFALPTETVGDNDVSDYLGHGTHVTGTIAAVAGNGIGVAGVCDSVQVMVCKNFPNAYFSVSAQAVYYASAMGARIMNMSWGGDFTSKTLLDAIEYARDRGALAIAAAGNTGDERNHYPASYDNTLAIGATTSSDEIAAFSTIGNFLDLSAPGQMILSLRGAGTDLYADGGEPNSHIIADNYMIASGTSMATPHVSGAAAALLALAPGLTSDELADIIRQSAHDIIDPYGEGNSFPGWDKYSGAGRLDVAAALSLLPTLRADIQSPGWNEVLDGAITIVGTASGSGFTEYTVSYGEGTNPDSWIDITTSQTSVEDDELAIWDPIAEGLLGRYTLQLTVGPGAVAHVPVVVVSDPVAEIVQPLHGGTVRLFDHIIGSAAAPDFSEYVVTAIGPLPSQTVTQIERSSQMVFSDTLAQWELENLATGEYYLRLTTVTDTESEVDSVLVEVENPFAAGWPVTIPAFSHFAILAADLDRNGSEEIVVPSTRGVWVLSSDGSIYPGWPRDTLADFEATPAIADLDGDGLLEIIATADDAVHVYSLIGEQYEGWPRPFDGLNNVYGTAIPTVGYLDDDSKPEVLAVDRTGKVRAWHESGVPYQPLYPPANWTIKVDQALNASLPRVTVADVDAAGGNEVVAAGDGIWIWDARTGFPYGASPSGKVRDFYITNGLAAADFDGDGVMELAVAFANGATEPFQLTIMELDGTDLPGWPRNLALSLNLNLLYSIAAGDMDDDGSPEVFVAPYSLGEGIVFAFHSDGSPLLPENDDGRFATVDGSLSAIGLVDVNSDSRPEVVFKAGNLLFGNESIYAYYPDGTFVEGYPIFFGAGSGPRPSMPLISDATGDGILNMVTVQSSGQQLVMWNLPSLKGYGGRPWTSFRADAWNSGVLPQANFNILEIVKLIDYVFRGGRSPAPFEPGDMDCNGHVDLLDVVTLINYVFRSGPRPCFP